MSSSRRRSWAKCPHRSALLLTPQNPSRWKLEGCMKTKPQKIKSLLQELRSARLQTFPKKPSDLVAPKKQGVYVIYDPNDRVCHVGCTYRAQNGLYQRLRNHMQSQSSFSAARKIWNGKRLRGKYKFRCLPVASPRQRIFLEALAVGTLCPAHVGSHQKRTS